MGHQGSSTLSYMEVYRAGRLHGLLLPSSQFHGWRPKASMKSSETLTCINEKRNSILLHFAPHDTEKQHREPVGQDIDFQVHPLP
jgi:hypothetical protein